MLLCTRFKYTFNYTNYICYESTKFIIFFSKSWYLYNEIESFFFIPSSTPNKSLCKTPTRKLYKNNNSIVLIYHVLMKNKRTHAQKHYTHGRLGTSV